MPIFERYLSDANLQELANYKYKAGMYTHLDEFLSEYVWGSLVHYLPIWLAPNLLTLLGFLCSCIGVLLTICYSPMLDSEIPPHICFAIAFCILAYQTLDALDGKQARRTGASNSLGTLFDHGCDVLTTSFVVIINLGAIGTGLTRLSIALFTITHFCQFICIWYEYYFDYFMAANNKFIGVTELQFGSMVHCILAGVFGLSWSRITFFGQPLSVLIPLCMFSYQIYECTKYMIKGIYNLTKQQRGDNRDPDLKLRRAVTQLCIFVPFVIVQWLFLNEAVIIGKMWVPFALSCVIFANATVNIRFILASCSNRTFHTIQWPVIPFIGLALTITFGNAFGLKFFQNYSKSHLNVVGVALLLYEIVYFLDFVVDSITGMASVLKIRVFHIPSENGETAKSK